jgi:alpha-L-rhamnosidase
MLPALAADHNSFIGPVELRVDNLMTPIGIDDAQPKFSWQLQDSSRGARQSAYEILVATRQERLLTGKPDLWDSGRVKSDQSLNVRYGGPALQPGTRYFWRVKVWGNDDKPYAASKVDWWETGLLKQDAWQAPWIGFETPEEAAVRHAPALWINYPGAERIEGKKGDQQRYAYRAQVNVTKPVRSAALYATGEDTVSAWINGAQVLSASGIRPGSICHGRSLSVRRFRRR